METLGWIGQGFQVALSPTNLLFCFIGVLMGTLIGVLPGIGPVSGVAILIQGHDDGYLDKEAVHFLEAGYAVILRGMPGFANDYLRIGNQDYRGDHDVLYDLESDDFNPMTVFAQPNIVAVNLASYLFPGKEIVVAGLSGGAHMALLLQALDQRVSRSISVSINASGFVSFK